MADELQDLFEVPLFPLGVVLFPGMALPLHIFEPCNRDMIADCLADQAPFGVVLAVAAGTAGQQAPAKIGTLARIVDYEKLPDDRYNLLALGTRRFQVLETRHERSYLTGLVRPFRDTTRDDANLGPLISCARLALRNYLSVVMSLVDSPPERQIDIPTDPEDLSFLIGICLTCEDCEKQELLEMASVAQRLREGARMLSDETTRMSHQVESGITSSHSDRSMLN
ncbi:MAG TPA: LON peptidase substrate-binding domain-containing protein [Ktedonobacterales bacterium]|nr:LON peptidase substrate-binding domain-containing protein [Ktedonobacterales bacterium]